MVTGDLSSWLRFYLLRALQWRGCDGHPSGDIDAATDSHELAGETLLAIVTLETLFALDAPFLNIVCYAVA